MALETMRARDACVAQLVKLESWAREGARDGPEYGDDDAPYAFWTAAEVLRSCDPEPNESVAAYFTRVERVARERLASIECPASHEALTIIAAAGRATRDVNGRDAFRAFGALGREAQIDALADACEDALRVWTAWAAPNQVEYIDSVVGMRHAVDVELPARALAEVRARKENPSTQREYSEPITALQDDDWEMPDAIEYAYYAVYNLHALVFAPNGSVTPLLVLNQAISATLRANDDAEIEERIVAWWKRVSSAAR